MKKTLLFFLLLAFASCTRPPANTPAPPQSEPVSRSIPDTTADREFVRVNSDNPAENGPSRRLDSVVVAPHRSLLDKVLGRTPKREILALPSRIGKKSTVSIYYGPATVSTTTIGKKATAATAEGASVLVAGKKSTAVVADSGATVQVAASQKGPAAAAGRDATATTIKPPTPWLKYGLWALGALSGYWVLFGGGGAVLLALWRRNKSNSNQA